MKTTKEFQETNVVKQGSDAHDDHDNISRISGISWNPESVLDYTESDFSVITSSEFGSVIASSTINGIEPGVSISKSVPLPVDLDDTVISSDSENNSRDEIANPRSRNSSRCRSPILICLTLVFITGSVFVFTTTGKKKTDAQSAVSTGKEIPDGPSAAPTYTYLPTSKPSDSPTKIESSLPSTTPTSTPTAQPTSSPTVKPTLTTSPTSSPTLTTSPTSSPTMTLIPSASPTTTLSPSASPSTIVGHIDSTEISQLMAHSLMMNQADIKNLTKVDRESEYNSDMTVNEKIMQRFSMLALWFSLSENNEMPPNLDECDWPFVGCENGIVKELHMPRRNFTGSISDTIDNLSSLRYIDLSENQIQGSIPEQLYSLSGLEYLYLHENRMTGILSESIGNLRDLKYLYLCRNNFGGQIPDKIKSAQSLNHISLCYNKFIGTLPSKLNLRDLRYVDFSFNKLRGSIPYDMFYKCWAMKWLYLDHNKLTGQIPVETVTAGGDDLETIDLGYNRFTGSFPYTLDWVENNGKLSTLNIKKNKLKKKLSQKICNMSVFEYGDVVQLEADCKVCTCDTFCEWCWGDYDDDYDYGDGVFVGDDD